jgi:hypothetical protein
MARRPQQRSEHHEQEPGCASKLPVPLEFLTKVNPIVLAELRDAIDQRRAARSPESWNAYYEVFINQMEVIADGAS